MTIRSLGYDGSIGERESAVWLPTIGSPPTVVGASDFQVTASGGLTVRAAPGVAAGWGVYDVSDASESITIAAATGSVRYDCVVLRRDWSGTSTTPSGSPTGGRSFIAVVQGGSSPVVPSLNSNPGVLTDQALGLVQVSPGASTVTIYADLRASYSGAAVVRSLLAMTGPLGSRYVLAPTGKRYVMGLTTAGTAQAMEEWEPPAPPPPAVPRIAWGTAACTFGPTGWATIMHNLGYMPEHITADPRLASESGLVTVDVQSWNAASMTVVAKAPANTAAGWRAYTGNLTNVDWIAVG